MEKKEGWKRELDDLLEDYWGYPDGGTEEGFIRGEMGIFELVEQELDKAREEGYKAMLEGLDNIARDSSGDFYKGVAIIKLRNEIARLYKLKDNK